MPELDSKPRIEDAEIIVTRYDGTIEIHKPKQTYILTNENEDKKEIRKTEKTV